MMLHLDDPMPQAVTGAIDAVRRIASEIAAPAAADVDHAARFPHEAIQALRQEHLLSPGMPVSMGGQGASLRELCTMTAALSEHCSSTGMIFAMHQIQLACLAHHGGDRAFLRDVLAVCEERQWLLASATSEVGTGGDIATSIAPLVAAGSSVVLRKRCSVISYGEHADAVLATARRSEDASRTDQAFVLLRREALQLTRTSDWNPMGMRGTCSPGFELHARESASAVLPEAAGAIISNTVLPWSHLLWASVWMGIATAAAQRAGVAYRQAAKDLRDGDALPFSAPRLVDVMSNLDQLRALIRDGLVRLESTPPGPRRRAPGFTMAMNHVKLTGARLVTALCMDSLAVCGMAGYSNDSPISVARWLRDACSAALMISNERLAHTNATLALLSRVEALG